MKAFQSLSTGLALQILDDEDDAAAAVVAGPARQDRRHVDHVLHAMDDHRMLRILGQRDEALDTQKLRALRGAQEVEERVECALRDRPLAGEAECVDALVMPVHVVVMMTM